MEIELNKIKQLAQGIVNQYRMVLANEGINASSTLSKTADVAVDYNGDKVVISLLLEPYWRYVEYGRRPGKFPPMDSIKEWIKVKPVIPDARTGTIPTTDQLAFMIARKISREGIPAKHVINKTVYTDTTENIMAEIKREIVRQLTSYYLTK